MTDDFAQKYGPWAVIAGASEGVGACLADQLAERGLDLVLIARNQELLEEVAAGGVSDTASRCVPWCWT
jgi:short-subunit dehydrogenase